MKKLPTVISTAIILTGLYALWTHSIDKGNLVVMSVAALIISSLFSYSGKLPPVTPRRIAYAAAYLPYLLLAIVRANLDVASRVVKKRIPINPGIVSVKTKLKSPLGRTVLANSITLTPGTLSVDIYGDRLFVHWIDIKDVEEKGATEEIVQGFERFLEVIFG